MFGHFWTYNFEVEYNNESKVYKNQKDYVKYFGINEFHVENEDQQIRHKELMDNEEVKIAESMNR